MGWVQGPEHPPAGKDAEERADDVRSMGAAVVPGEEKVSIQGENIQVGIGCECEGRK